MSEECGTAIDEFKNHVTILKMPKKGGTGLPQSLAMMCEFALKLAKKEDVSDMIKEYAYHLKALLIIMESSCFAAFLFFLNT